MFEKQCNCKGCEHDDNCLLHDYNRPCPKEKLTAKSFVEHGAKALDLIFAGLRKAEEKHPCWPDDLIHAVGILAEEAGGAMQAAIDCTYAMET